MSNFKETQKEIDEINASQNDHVAGHNMFSDYDHQEYKQMLNGLNTGLSIEDKFHERVYSHTVFPMADSDV